jgi:hypothetical protein
MTGTIGAAAKVETKEMKNPSQDMWKDMWCGRWNEKMFKDIALCSLFYFSSEKKKEKEMVSTRPREIPLKKRERTPTRARRQRTDPTSNSPFHRDGTTKKTFSYAFYPSSEKSHLRNRCDDGRVA